MTEQIELGSMMTTKPVGQLALSALRRVHLLQASGPNMVLAQPLHPEAAANAARVEAGFEATLQVGSHARSAGRKCLEFAADVLGNLPVIPSTYEVNGHLLAGRQAGAAKTDPSNYKIY